MMLLITTTGRSDSLEVTLDDICGEKKSLASNQQKMWHAMINVCFSQF